MNVPTPALRTPSHDARDVAIPSPTRHGELTTRSAWWFFAATFAVTWGLGVLVVAFMDQVESIFGPMGYTNPVFILMVYSPGFVALFMVWRHYGIRGLAAFLRRLTLWRMSTGWWLLLLVGMPAVFYAGAAVNGNVHRLPVRPLVRGAAGTAPGVPDRPDRGARLARRRPSAAAAPVRAAVGRPDRRWRSPRSGTHRRS